jgi:hypothetical protein
MIRQKHELWLAGAVFMALLRLAHSGDVSIPQVPFVTCPGTGGADPGPWPTPKRSPESLPRPPIVPVSRLAYYRAITGPGVFAPRGWHCRAWGCSNGAFIIVTPSEPPAANPREPVKGLGVIGVESYGGTSGRFEVAEISARLFPNIMAAFIARVKAEGFPSPDFAKIHRFSHDQYTYLTPRLVKFMTAGRHKGIGTGILVPSKNPVYGVVSLSPGHTRHPDLLEYAVRLPSSDYQLTQALTDLEVQCVMVNWPNC